MWKLECSVGEVFCESASVSGLPQEKVTLIMKVMVLLLVHSELSSKQVVVIFSDSDFNR